MPSALYLSQCINVPWLPAMNDMYANVRCTQGTRCCAPTRIENVHDTDGEVERDG